jgi:MFS transporter, CP family, cyanate transporter
VLATGGAPRRLGHAPVSVRVETPASRPPLIGNWLPLVVLVAVGLNLRGPIVAVAPVLEDLRQDLQIAEATVGLLTSVPVLCFAAISPLVAVIARRIGTDTTVTVSLVLLALALAVRPWSGFGLMLAGTLLMGVAIAAGNVLLPVIARRDYPARPGPAVSAATTSLLVSASISAVVTVPLARLVGWRAALAMWAVLAVVAFALWWVTSQRRRARGGRDSEPPEAASGTAGEVDEPDHGDPARASGVRVPSAWRALAAWELGVLFGVQSLLFYATTAWLPTMLQAHGGIQATAAGTALSMFHLFGIAGALTVPMLVHWRRIRYVAGVLASLWVAFLAGILFAPGAWPLWGTLGGVAQGGCLALCLTLIAVRSRSDDATRSVSAMVQSVGYCLGAVGPVLMGALTAATAGWTAPVSVMIALAAVLGVLAVRSATPRPIR